LSPDEDEDEMGTKKMTPEEWEAELRRRDEFTRRLQERVDTYKARLPAQKAQPDRRESS
jgi:hypothetical protein